jgi:hypothetical protein
MKPRRTPIHPFATGVCTACTRISGGCGPHTNLPDSRPWWPRRQMEPPMNADCSACDCLFNPKSQIRNRMAPLCCLTLKYSRLSRPRLGPVRGSDTLLLPLVAETDRQRGWNPLPSAGRTAARACRCASLECDGRSGYHLAIQYLTAGPRDREMKIVLSGVVL